MKRNFLLCALLFSILFWGVNAAVFAQEQVNKDAKVPVVKKTVVKKVETKKDTLNKGVTKKVVVKKDLIKKSTTAKEDVTTTKKEVVKKDVTTVRKDKIVGKTDGGKVIYIGPNGGQYTLDANGKKVYIKKVAK